MIDNGAFAFVLLRVRPERLSFSDSVSRHIQYTKPTIPEYHFTEHAALGLALLIYRQSRCLPTHIQRSSLSGFLHTFYDHLPPETKSQMMDLNSAVDLNNQAVTLLGIGEYTQANTLLVQALHNVVAVTSAASRERFPASSPVQVPCVTALNQNLISPVPLGHSDNSHQDDRTALSFYNHAFAITCDENRALGSSDHDTTKLSAVLLFNMATSYHFLATTTSSKEFRLYTTALKLYTSAWCLLSSSEFSTSEDGFFVLTLALLNNKAHLHACFHDGEKAYLCLEWLQNMLTQSREDVWTMTDMSVFRENAFLYKRVVDCHAASA